MNTTATASPSTSTRPSPSTTTCAAPATQATGLTRQDGELAAAGDCPGCGRAFVAPLSRLDFVPCACPCGARFTVDVRYVVPTEVP